MTALEKERLDCQDQIKTLLEKAKTDQTAQEARFRQERARWKAQLESLRFRAGRARQRLQKKLSTRNPFKSNSWSSSCASKPFLMKPAIAN